MVSDSRVPGWSQDQFAEINAAIEELLDEYRDIVMVDRITVIRGYEQLAILHPDDPSFGRKLRRGILDLADVVDVRGKKPLATRLRFLAQISMP